jgi:hypothetical protein
LFDELSGEEVGSSNFTASRGWLLRFKNRTKLHNVKMSGEAAGDDITAAYEFPIIFKNLSMKKSLPQT